ncbi:unnamed protein product [Amoebophrya sp. A25]|nr:unnamed protein product [Amoebophrya sp. A25]|eukprot:GSA25T00009961001.1
MKSSSVHGHAHGHNHPHRANVQMRQGMGSAHMEAAHAMAAAATHHQANEEMPTRKVQAEGEAMQDRGMPKDDRLRQPYEYDPAAAKGKDQPPSSPVSAASTMPGSYTSASSTSSGLMSKKNKKGGDGEEPASLTQKVKTLVSENKHNIAMAAVTALSVGAAYYYLSDVGGMSSAAKSSTTSTSSSSTSTKKETNTYHFKVTVPTVTTEVRHG